MRVEEKDMRVAGRTRFDQYRDGDNGRDMMMMMQTLVLVYCEERGEGGFSRHEEYHGSR